MLTKCPLGHVQHFLHLLHVQHF
jgi:hypothetical protein